jgi:antirestriction protein
MKTYNTMQKLAEQHETLCDYIHVKEIAGEYTDNHFEILDSTLYEVLDKETYKEAEILMNKLKDIIQVGIDSVQFDFNAQARKQGVRI